MFVAPGSLWRFLALLIITSIIVIMLRVYVVPYYRLSINITDSLPHRIYLVRLRYTSVPERGDLLLFRPPTTSFYPVDALFMKYVNGVAGDCVQHIRKDTRQAWLINGKFQGWLKPLARDGSALHPGPIGRIPTGYISVHTPSKDSYDSRYADIGWIPLHRIVGYARPLFGHHDKEHGGRRSSVRNQRDRHAAADTG